VNRLKREGELAKGRTDQGANKPGGESYTYGRKIAIKRSYLPSVN